MIDPEARVKEAHARDGIPKGGRGARTRGAYTRRKITCSGKRKQRSNVSSPYAPNKAKRPAGYAARRFSSLAGDTVSSFQEKEEMGSQTVS
ncbi:MAG: hypothetical protein E7422_05635 [Ruminococcaceae bacterium]|nr:hypothetical protein [Oscillospiraceae bacterium]